MPSRACCQNAFLQGPRSEHSATAHDSVLQPSSRHVKLRGTPASTPIQACTCGGLNAWMLRPCNYINMYISAGAYLIVASQPIVAAPHTYAPGVSPCMFRRLN